LISDVLTIIADIPFPFFHPFHRFVNFPSIDMFLQWIPFWNQKLVFMFNLWAIFSLYNVHKTIRFHLQVNPRQLGCPRNLKLSFWFISPSLIDFWWWQILIQNFHHLFCGIKIKRFCWRFIWRTQTNHMYFNGNGKLFNFQSSKLMHRLSPTFAVGSHIICK